MAMGGKTAGILSGLGIGAAAGVMLAALNPILPRTDVTEVADVPLATAPQAPETEEPATPQPTTDVAIAAPKIAPGVEPQAPEAPVSSIPDRPEAAPVGPVATEVAGLAAPSPQGETDPIVTGTDVTTVTTPQAPGTDASVDLAPEAAPAVDAASAAPVDLPAPEAATDAPSGPATTVAGRAPEATGPLDAPTPTAAPASAPELPDASAGIAVAEDARTPAPQPVETRTARVDPVPEADPIPASTGAQPTTPEIKADTVNTVGNPGVKLESQPPRTVGRLKTLGETGSSRFPQVGADSNRLASLGSGGSSRLPRIGGGEESAPAAAATATAEAPKGALEAHRVNFAGSDKPMLSVIVLDDGRTEARLEELRALGLPVAVAIAADDDNAMLRARSLRNAGLEVLALAPRDVSISLSGNLNADQVAATLDQIFARVPDAIGLIDRPEATIQRDRRLARHIVGHFAETGHGLVTYGGGLNAVPRLAEQDGVRAGQVFRFLDDTGGTRDAVRRTLNRALLDARSKGHVIVMTSPNAETLAAIAEWARSPRGSAVSLAPVSAALLAGENG